jgi:plasmid stabilization system protein ParE
VKLRILDLAEADILLAIRFYERQSVGVGQYFLSAISSDIESLRLYAGIHRRSFGYRRLLSKRFPFAIYYKVMADEVFVWRVLDCRRKPVWIRRQLGSSER